MSHFTVLVRLPAAEIANIDDEQLSDLLEAKLQPYHEYECTGVKDQYVIQYDETEEKLEEYEESTGTVVFDETGTALGQSYRSEFDKYRDSSNNLTLPEGWEVKEKCSLKVLYPTFESWITEYHGYDVDGDYTSFKDGRVYRYTNPNRKWDWWTVGGRWSNHFLDKDGETHDVITKGEWDIEKASANAVLKFIPYYDTFAAHTFENEFFTWDKCRELHADDINAARDLYWKQPYRAEFNEVMSKAPQSNETSWITREPDYFNVTREKFIADRVFGELGTYAVLDDGWHEKGEMGWFGMSSNENADWNDLFLDKIKSFDDNDLLVLVDCHI